MTHTEFWRFLVIVAYVSILNSKMIWALELPLESITNQLWKMTEHLHSWGHFMATDTNCILFLIMKRICRSHFTSVYLWKWKWPLLLSQAIQSPTPNPLPRCQFSTAGKATSIDSVDSWDHVVVSFFLESALRVSYIVSMGVRILVFSSPPLYSRIFSPSLPAS